jgi:hypothetical protein
MARRSIRFSGCSGSGRIISTAEISDSLRDYANPLKLDSMSPFHSGRKSMTLPITRTDLTAEQLRAAAREPDARIARRILAIAMVLSGYSRSEAAEAHAMDRQTRDWVMRYHDHGFAGLVDRPGPGVRRRSAPIRRRRLIPGSNKAPIQSRTA